MYIKTRSTLAGLTAASLFVVAGWLFGHPIATVTPVAPSMPAAMVSITLASNLPSHPAPEIGRSASRMSLAMPYFSFALLRTRKGIN